MNENLEKLMRILTDSYAIKILAASYHEEKSAIQLSQELNVPIAACYRRLHSLQSMNLISVSVKTNYKGKKIKYYNSNIKKASIQIENNHIYIELFDKDGNVKKYSGKIVGKGYGE